MGVKQTTDVLEKGTWVFASLIGLLCIVSVLFFSNSAGSSNDNNMLKDLPTSAPASQQRSAPSGTLPLSTDSGKK